jgi:hypothetical protein
VTKGHTKQFIKRNYSSKPEVQIRELPPKVNMLKEGAQILCPFCDPPHPIMVGQDSACGTTMKVSAVQTIYPARTTKKHNLICIKCSKGGGEMVKFNNSFVHAADCAPGTKLITVPPEFSRLAKFIYHLPKWIRTQIEKVTGFAKEVKEVSAEGKETGKILGYFFYSPDPPPSAVKQST